MLSPKQNIRIVLLPMEANRLAMRSTKEGHEHKSPLWYCCEELSDKLNQGVTEGTKEGACQSWLSSSDNEQCHLN